MKEGIPKLIENVNVSKTLSSRVTRPLHWYTEVVQDRCVQPFSENTLVQLVAENMTFGED